MNWSSKADGFETADSAFGGEMTITVSLADVDVGTHLVAVQLQKPGPLCEEDIASTHRLVAAAFSSA